MTSRLCLFAAVLKNKDFRHYQALGKNNHFQSGILLPIQNNKTKSVTSDKYWIGPKVRSGFPILSYGKSQANFWAKPIIYTLSEKYKKLTELFIVLGSEGIGFHLKCLNINTQKYCDY